MSATRRRAGSAARFSLLPLCLMLAQAHAAAVVEAPAPGVGPGAVITYGATSLGVNASGELNHWGAGPRGTMLYGVYRDPIGDAIAPGCPCEGWGVAATLDSGAREAVWANQSTGSGGFGTGNTFAYTANSATSVVNMAAAPGLSVRQTYGASLSADIFQVQVTITNHTGSAVNDLVYRRAMDWDVPPSAFNEYVTHSGVSANLVSNGGNIAYAGNNGFATTDPRRSAQWENAFQATYANPSVAIDTTNTDFNKAGIADHGSVFDFSFGTLADGASRIFNIFYGSAANEVEALKKTVELAMNMFSLGQSSGTAATPSEGATTVADGSNNYDPAAHETFIFGFSGVNGTELGATQDNPLLPILGDVTANQLVFDAPVSRRWYDPPMASAYDIAVEGGGTISRITLPTGFDDLTVVAGGTTYAGLKGGASLAFDIGMPSIRISGFTVDSADPTAFPLYMEFAGDVTRMTWTPELAAAVPEPGTYALMLLGLGGLSLMARRQRRIAR